MGKKEEWTDLQTAWDNLIDLFHQQVGIANIMQAVDKGNLVPVFDEAANIRTNVIKPIFDRVGIVGQAASGNYNFAPEILDACKIVEHLDTIEGYLGHTHHSAIQMYAALIQGRQLIQEVIAG